MPPAPITLRYYPTDEGVPVLDALSVDTIELFPTRLRAPGAGVSSTGPAVEEAPGVWRFDNVPYPGDGRWHTVITWTAADGTEVIDADNTLDLPLTGVVAGWTPGVVPWVRANELDCDLVSDVDCIVATEILWALSGRRYPGLATRTVRPVGARHRGGRCGGHCDELASSLDLGPGVVTVDEVLVDGAAVTAWTLADDRWLLRDDGQGWPSCQDITEPATETGTVQVTYRSGVAPPLAGEAAAGALACELAKARADQACQIPAKVTSIVRQGVSMEILDPTALLEDGRTGIVAVDLFLQAVNPERHVEPARVLIPGAQRTRTVRHGS